MILVEKQRVLEADFFSMPALPFIFDNVKQFIEISSNHSRWENVNVLFIATTQNDFSVTRRQFRSVQNAT